MRGVQPSVGASGPVSGTPGVGQEEDVVQIDLNLDSTPAFVRESHQPWGMVCACYSVWVCVVLCSLLCGYGYGVLVCGPVLCVHGWPKLHHQNTHLRWMFYTSALSRPTAKSLLPTMRRVLTQIVLSKSVCAHSMIRACIGST